MDLQTDPIPEPVPEPEPELEQVIEAPVEDAMVCEGLLLYMSPTDYVPCQLTTESPTGDVPLVAEPEEMAATSGSRRASVSSQTKPLITEVQSDSPSGHTIQLKASNESLARQRIESNNSVVPPGSFAPEKGDPVTGTEPFPSTPPNGSPASTALSTPTSETATDRFYGVVRRFSRSNSLFGAWR